MHLNRRISFHRLWQLLQRYCFTDSSAPVPVIHDTSNNVQEEIRQASNILQQTAPRAQRLKSERAAITDICDAILLWDSLSGVLTGSANSIIILPWLQLLAKLLYNPSSNIGPFQWTPHTATSRDSFLTMSIHHCSVPEPRAWVDLYDLKGIPDISFPGSSFLC